MSAENDLITLYSKRILALAADMPFTDRLDDPDGTARVRSPLCESTVTVDLGVDGETINRFGQDVKACALGQASASAVAKNIIGRDRQQIQTARDEMSAMLKAGGPPPAEPFAELEALKPARDYKNRHASIMLTLDAILAAFRDADSRKEA